MVYDDIVIANNTKITKIPILIIIKLFLLTGSPQKLKLKIIHATLIVLFHVSPRFPQLQRVFFFY